MSSPYNMSDDMPVYVISVAANLSGMHPQTLRGYERVGLVTPRRTAGGGRRYSMRDILALREIQRLSQEEGINLSGIKRILDLERELEQARLMAAELHAEVVLMAKNGVEGVYSADPAKHPDAEFIPEITHKEALTRGLQVMDSTAFALCMDNNLPIIVFNMADGKNIDKIVSGERVGTLVRT